MEPTRKRIPISEIDPRQALHELQLYHQELEHQNRQLQEIRRQNELLIQKYTTLYTQSPSGYLTLDRNGKILELNAVAIQTLAQDHGNLLNEDFRAFISKNSKQIFDEFFEDIFLKKQKISCDALLAIEPLTTIHFEGISTEDGQSCFITMMDITTLKNTEEALNLSRKEFQSYFENGSVGMTVSSPGKGWIEINQKFCQMLGYTKEELIGINWMDLSHPDDLSANIDLYQKALNGELDRYQMDKKFIRKDGQLLYVTLAVSCQRNEDGSLHHLLSSYVDITEHKLLEIKLRKSEEKYRTLLEFAPDAFFQGDAQGNLIIANDKAVELTGYSRKELLSMNISELFSPEILYVKPLRYDLLETNATVTTEREIQTKDGQLIQVEMTSKKMPDSTYQSLMKNITAKKIAEEALKESEERFRSIFEDSPDAIIIADLKRGVIIDANHAAEKLFLRSRIEMEGMDHFLLHPNEDHDKVTFSEWGKKPGMKGTNLPIETTIIRSDGKKVPAEIISKVIFLKGKPAIYGTFRDISKRKHAETALRESEKRYRLIAENSGNLIWILDLSTRKFRYVSPSVFSMFGYTIEEMMAQDASFLIMPEFLETLRDNFRKRIQNYYQGSAETYFDEMAQRCKNGSIIWTETETRLMQGQGNHLELLGVTRDITQRKVAQNLLKESEERFREIFDSSPDASLIADIETGLINNANKAACKLLKRKIDEIIGLHQSKIHPPRMEVESKTLFRQYVTQGRNAEKKLTYESVVIRSDGKEIPVEIQAIRLSLHGKKVLHCSFREISAWEKHSDAN